MPQRCFEGLILADTYRVGRLLGYGGMGRVHEAEHLRLPKKFAVKFLEQRLARDGIAYVRFRREAEIASSLGNPHIAQVLDFNTLPDGAPYMIMELLEGEDLSQRLATGPMPALEVLRLSEHMALALGDAHAMGVVHRDIKPDNVFLCFRADGEPFTAKILDFGVSKLRAVRGLTGIGALVGTPAYMSPEQAHATDGKVDHRADIYSMAAVLYEALSGEPLWDSADTAEILSQVATREPPPLRRHPPEVDAVLRRALAPDPEDRHPSAQELHQDLVAAICSAHGADRPALPRAPSIDALVPVRVDPVAPTEVREPARAVAGQIGSTAAGRLAQGHRYVLEIGVLAACVIITLAVALGGRPGSRTANAAKPAPAATVHPEAAQAGPAATVQPVAVQSAPAAPLPDPAPASPRPGAEAAAARSGTEPARPPSVPRVRALRNRVARPAARGKEPMRATAPRVPSGPRDLLVEGGDL